MRRALLVLILAGCAPLVPEIGSDAGLLIGPTCSTAHALPTCPPSYTLVCAGLGYTPLPHWVRGAGGCEVDYFGGSTTVFDARLATDPNVHTCDQFDWEVCGGTPSHPSSLVCVRDDPTVGCPSPDAGL